MRKYFAIALFVIGLSTSAWAGLNLNTGVTGGYGASTSNLPSPSLYLGGEFTFNIIDIIELGLFYDQNLSLFNNLGSANLFGPTLRIGFGPLLGLFLDGKAGFSTTHMGLGGGLGLGYHISKKVSVHAGPRILTGLLGVHILGDVNVMFTF